MLLFRWAILLLLLVAGVSFAFYVGTGQTRYRRFGWVTHAVSAFVISRSIELDELLEDPETEALVVRAPQLGSFRAAETHSRRMRLTQRRPRLAR